MTAYNRAPVSGLWENDGKTVYDDVVIYEVMSEQLEHAWWRQYRRTLEQHFRQQTLLIRAQAVELI
ncbi:hypothetical protein [Noviherbaspirillum saxi]|uniref:hypothetical protein n=1 Tax=Noviherbaspirillum saxi TaxID=2320863 RepID=UPI0018F5E376|nr:hypothetical protein [Noviherbaspirillum saxi]